MVRAVHAVALSGSFCRACMREEGLEDGKLGGEAFGGRREAEREVGREGRLGDAEVGSEDAGHHEADDAAHARLVLHSAYRSVVRGLQVQNCGVKTRPTLT